MPARIRVKLKKVPLPTCHPPITFFSLDHRVVVTAVPLIAASIGSVTFTMVAATFPAALSVTSATSSIMAATTVTVIYRYPEATGQRRDCYNQNGKSDKM
jgi:hypothetical protein